MLDKLDIPEELRGKLKDKIIDGKTIAHERNEKMTAFCEQVMREYCLQPGLAIIRVGNDYASEKYVNTKNKVGKEIGVDVSVYEYDEDVEETQLLHLIEDLNWSDNIHGILIQLPLPNHLSEERLINAIKPNKDVDGFHPYNVGNLFAGKAVNTSVPCTAKGVIELIKSTGEEIAGKKAVVLGRSNIVGRPVAALLEQENATVTVCHSKTQPAELALAVRSADIVVSAIGKPNYLKRGVLGMNQIIIDVGINRDEEGALCGDVHFVDGLMFAKYITPVPGGVGPMTVSCLMENTIRSMLNICGINQKEFIL